MKTENKIAIARKTLATRFEEVSQDNDFSYIDDYLASSTQVITSGSAKDIPIEMLYLPIELTVSIASKLENRDKYFIAVLEEEEKRVSKARKERKNNT